MSQNGSTVEENTEGESQYPQLHLDNQLCFRLYSLSRKITQAYGPLLRPLGLTYPQYLVFMVLWQQEEQGNSRIPVKVLSESLLLDTGTLTPLLKRLEQNGLVRRERSSEDERIVLISLTGDGMELREQAKDIPGQLLCATGVDQGQAAELRDTLQGCWKC